LKNIKTNSELKAIFDHINEKCNGGIIVFEDIDAMTKIVLRRKKLEESSLTDVLEEANDDITLQYLLNLLDGSLCKDGTIFAITTNYIENIDDALYRKGRVDICIEFKKCDHYQINMIFESIIGRGLDGKILEKIPENKYAPCDIIFHVYQYMLEDIDDEIIMKEFMTI
jgi:ATP-dependent 26S proteasome regulatory subunit